MQAIVIPGSPETGSNDYLGIGDDGSGEAASTPPVLQVIPSPIGVGSRLGRFEFTRTGLKRLSLLDRILTNSYLPARGSGPPKEEVSVLESEDVKHIVHRWKPFNWGESATNRLNSLYPVML